MGVSIQNPGLKLFEEESIILHELGRKKKLYLLDGTKICFGLFNEVVLLLFVQVRVGCSRAETNPNGCGEARIRFPVMTGVCD